MAKLKSKKELETLIQSGYDAIAIKHKTCPGEHFE
jgi:hypothetical protein